MGLNIKFLMVPSWQLHNSYQFNVAYDGLAYDIPPVS